MVLLYYNTLLCYKCIIGMKSIEVDLYNYTDFLKGERKHTYCFLTNDYVE